MTETLSIPGYTIERKLGQGGMASVYLAIQESFGREVALKVMSPELSADPSFATRFMREARIVAVLSHASIVPVFEVGEHGSVYYLSMEYLPAGDLKDRIQQGQANVGLAIDVCMAVCSALDVAHRKGFVHRDIKPENIMFREDGTPVVTDFGIARALDSGNSLTMAGMMVGTPAYMSPEQVRGQELDGRSDLYSVGVVFYEILTGGLPFEADSSLSVALKHLSDRLPTLPPELGEYQEFFERLTAKSREARFATGADVVRALRSFAPVRETEVTTLVRPRLTAPITTDPMLVPPAVPATPPAQAFVPVPEKAPDRTPDRKAPLPFPKAKPNEAARPGMARHDRSDRPAQARPAASPMAPPPRSPARPAAPQAYSATEILPGRAPGLVGEVRTALRRDGPARNSMGWIAAGALTAAATVGVAMLLMKGPSPAQDAAAQPPTHVSVPQATSAFSAAQEAPQEPHDAGPALTAANTAVAPKTPDTPALPPPQAQSSAESVQSAVPPAAPPAAGASAAPAPPAAASVGTPAGTGAGPAVVSTRPERPAMAPPTAAPQPPGRLRPSVQQRLALINAQNAASAANKVRELLVAARTSLVTGALLSPNGNCARDQYLAVLQLRPKQPEALEGVKRLANILADEASRYEAFGDITQASYYIIQAHLLQPNNPRLGALQEKLSQLQAKPLKLDQRDKNHVDQVDQAVAKAHDRLKRLPFDAHSVGDATELYDQAMAEEPNAPGLPSLRNQLIAAYPPAVQTERSMRDFHSADMLIDAARKHGWVTVELERASRSTLPPLPKFDNKPAPKVDSKPGPAPGGSN